MKDNLTYIFDKSSKDSTIEDQHSFFKNYVKKLNKDIETHFPHITQIKNHFNITHEGIQRMVMLDRYAQKDKDLKTLSVNDLVITVIKEDKWFPARGIGYIKEIKGLKAIIQLEDQYLYAVDQSILIDGNKIEVNITEIDKPMEIFYEQIVSRVAKELSSKESPESQKEWEKKFYSELKNKRLVPAGRVLYGAGSKTNVTFFNCFVMPFIHDSRGGIGKHRQEIMEIMSRGGGVGTNGSTLRPKNAQAKKVGGRSSGAVSWLNDMARLTHLVEQGGSRRGAQMIMLSDWHPDVIEFIISKMQKPEILKYLVEHGKDPLIRTLASNKLVFKPISNENRIAYQAILNNEEELNKLTDSERASITEKVSKGGEYEIEDIDQLSGANISITLSDAFMKAVKNDEDWELRFPDIDNYNDEEKDYYDENWQDCGDIFEWEKQHKMKIKVYYKIKAVALWDLINFCATYSAEPGVFFLDRANKDTNATGYGMKVVATNPCGEQPLPPYSVCNLSAINLESFVNKDTKEILYDDLDKTVRVAVRFQDNIIDTTPYFLEANEIQAKGERRVGLGVMGLHDLLIWSGIRYGSKKSLETIDKLFFTIATSAYDESVNIAKEKGSFPFLKDNEKFVNAGFIKKLPKELRERIIKNGIRNSHLLTVAPTGTTGTMTGVSTGLEPYFAFKYFRSGRLGQMMEVEADIVKEYYKHHNLKKTEKLPNIFVSANELTPEDHVTVQATIQKWVDSSISKTVNAPAGFTVKQVEKIYEMLYDLGAKGGTVYVDGSRSTQVLTLSDDEEEEVLHEFEETSHMSFDKIEEKLEEDVSFRGDRQNREIGMEAGNLCPLCKEGIVVVQGGCATCSNCNAQLKCGL